MRGSVIIPLVLVGACGHPAPRSSAAKAAGSSAAAADALAPGDHAVTLEGLVTAYHVRGAGPVCVAIPGGPGLDWSYLKMPALEQRLTVVYVEPLGTGGSAALPAGEPYTLIRYARQIESLRVALGGKPLCVIGHSYGGMIAERYAIAYPQGVTTLVLYGAPSRTGDDFAAAFMANARGYQGRAWYDAAIAAVTNEDHVATDAAATAAWKAALPIYFADFDAHADAYGAAAVTAYAAPLAGAAREGGKPTDFRPDFGKITARTLVVVGAHDVCCGRRWGDEIVAGVKGAQLVLLEESGHMSHLEEPDRFAQVVADFVIQ